MAGDLVIDYGKVYVDSNTINGSTNDLWYANKVGATTKFTKINFTGLSENVTTTTLISSYTIENIDGTSAEPSYSFSNDQNTGIYHEGGDSIGFSTNGHITAKISDTNNLSVKPGTANTPGFTSA